MQNKSQIQGQTGPGETQDVDQQGLVGFRVRQGCLLLEAFVDDRVTVSKVETSLLATAESSSVRRVISAAATSLTALAVSAPKVTTRSPRA